MTWNAIDDTPKDSILQSNGSPQPPETIHGVFFRYMFFLGLFAGVGRMGEVIPDPMAHNLISTFGYGTTVAFLACAFYEWRYTERKWALHEAREKAKLAKPTSSVPEKVEISVTHTTESGSQTRIYTFDKDKLPPADFVNFIFDAAGTDGRVLTERAIGEFQQWQGTGYNDWLSVMDKLEITKKVDERPNSARRLACTREVALQHFNYETKEQGE